MATSQTMVERWQAVLVMRAWLFHYWGCPKAYIDIQAHSCTTQVHTSTGLLHQYKSDSNISMQTIRRAYSGLNDTIGIETAYHILCAWGLLWGAPKHFRCVASTFFQQQGWALQCPKTSVFKLPCGHLEIFLDPLDVLDPTYVPPVKNASMQS